LLIARKGERVGICHRNRQKIELNSSPEYLVLAIVSPYIFSKTKESHNFAFIFKSEAEK